MYVYIVKVNSLYRLIVCRINCSTLRYYTVYMHCRGSVHCTCSIYAVYNVHCTMYTACTVYIPCTYSVHRVYTVHCTHMGSVVVVVVFDCVGKPYYTCCYI